MAIVDHNRLQQYGWQGDGPEHRLPPEAPGELRAKWAAFGWRVIEIDGHQHGEILDALDPGAPARDGPIAIIATTVKGKGVSFAEGRYEWHVRSPTPTSTPSPCAGWARPSRRAGGEAAR